MLLPGGKLGASRAIWPSRGDVCRDLLRRDAIMPRDLEFLTRIGESRRSGPSAHFADNPVILIRQPHHCSTDICYRRIQRGAATRTLMQNQTSIQNKTESLPKDVRDSGGSKPLPVNPYQRATAPQVLSLHCLHYTDLARWPLY